MKTVCDGWAPLSDGVRVHADRIVLKDNGVTDERVSHGMCPNCSAAMERASEYELERMTSGALAKSFHVTELSDWIPESELEPVEPVNAAGRPIERALGVLMLQGEK